MIAVCDELSTSILHEIKCSVPVHAEAESGHNRKAVLQHLFELFDNDGSGALDDEELIANSPIFVF